MGIGGALNREVAITGVGAVTALGTGARPLFERWCAGETGLEDGLGLCREFEPRDYLTVKEARRTDRFAQLAIAAADEALLEAGWGSELPYDPFRVACVVGTGIGGDETFESHLGRYRDDGAAAVSPLAVPRLMANAGAGGVAIRHGLRGPTAAVASACASGADAVAAAVRLIRTGEADAAVAGGAESAVSPFVQAAFKALGATSPSGVCRPFDARRDGFVLSEGAGVLVLEDADLARERGATILGRVVGLGCTSDAYHLTAPEENGVAAAAAISAALADAAIVPEDLDYVNAHGTGTALNDRAETEALKSALGPWAKQVPVSSAKSAIGHTLGAAGAVEAVLAVLALRSGTAPPTLGFEVRDDGLDLDYVGGSAEALPDGNNGAARYAISNSLGFGGHNVVLAVEA